MTREIYWNIGHGVMLPHSLFFWSFMTLFAGTLLIMLQIDFLSSVMDMNILRAPFTLHFLWLST